MSVSVQSETSKDEIDTEDGDLQDVVWTLMSQQGLLSEIRGRISRFMENNGKGDDINIIPGRADGKVLGLIFDYLQWVGMKQTSSVLLSESPLDVDVSMYESRKSGGDENKPELLRIYEYSNLEEADGGSPSKSHNYSRDEFEDSKMTSFSAHPSLKGNENEEVEDLASDNVEEEQEESSAVLHLSSGSKNREGSLKEASVTNQLGGKGGVENSSGSEKSASENQSSKALNGGATPLNNTKDVVININSPPDVGAVMPNVTVREKDDTDKDGSFFNDSFRSTLNNMGPNANFAIPVVTSDNRLNFVGSTAATEGPNKENASSSNPGNPFQKTVESANNKPNVNVTKRNVEDASRSTPDDESTSDFMATLSIEEDTQDISIPSESKGMSSCEHAVNLK